MNLRAEIQALLESTRIAAARARDEGEKDLALDLYQSAERMDAWLLGRLTVHARRPKIDRMAMATEHRQKLSASRFSETDKEHWMAYARRAGLPSLRAVATALGVAPSFISDIDRGRKKMPHERAERFEELTGYPAKRWPS